MDLVGYIIEGFIIVTFFGIFLSMAARMGLNYLLMWHLRKSILVSPLSTLNHIFIEDKEFEGDVIANNYLHYIDLTGKSIMIFVCLFVISLGLVVVYYYFLFG